MLDQLGAALEKAAELNAEAIRLVQEMPESDGRAVLASALRENRDALVRAGLTLAAAWEEGFAAGRTFERGQPAAPDAPPKRYLRAVAS